MPDFQTNRHVKHSPQNMFALIADVEKYPEFLPLCSSLVVRSRESEGARELLLADMTVEYKVFRETFTSQVTLDANAHTISTRYVNGPFRHLENVWRFNPDDGGGCVIDFFISYEFRSRMLQMVMGAAFDRAFRKFAAAFEMRADEIYGNAM